MSNPRDETVLPLRNKMAVSCQENSANEQTGAHVPNTVMNKQTRRPMTSLILPNSGHAKNAKKPRTKSANPNIIYT